MFHRPSCCLASGLSRLCTYLFIFDMIMRQHTFVKWRYHNSMENKTAMALDCIRFSLPIWDVNYKLYIPAELNRSLPVKSRGDPGLP